MKYYSDKTNKFYETEEECNNDEIEFEKGKLKYSKLKKALAKEIEDYQDKLNEQYKKYEDAQKQADEIMKEARNKADEIIENAKNEIRETQKKKEQALIDFNNKFGTYKVVYTGEDARKEFERTTKLFDNFFKNFWRF